MLRSSQKLSGRALSALGLLPFLLVGITSGCAQRAERSQAVAGLLDSLQQEQRTADDLTHGEAQKRDSQEPIENVLARRYPGVDVRKLGDGTLVIRMRGAGSFYGSTEPLIVIDGVPLASGHGGKLAGINPYTIESIEVLRHPPGTTQYGVRGANGVIVIKTKKAGG